MTKTLFGQRATHWANGSINGFGVSTFETPITISVHWEDKTSIIMTHDMREAISMAMVYLKHDQVIKVGDYLFLGESTDTKPIELEGAYEVKAIENIHGTRFGIKKMVKALL